LKDGSLAYTPNQQERMSHWQKVISEIETSPRFQNDPRAAESIRGQAMRKLQQIRSNPQYVTEDKRQPSIQEDYETNTFTRPDGVVVARDHNGNITYDKSGPELEIKQQEQEAKAQAAIDKAEDDRLNREDKQEKASLARKTAFDKSEDRQWDAGKALYEAKVAQFNVLDEKAKKWDKAKADREKELQSESKDIQNENRDPKKEAEERPFLQKYVDDNLTAKALEPYIGLRPDVGTYPVWGDYVTPVREYQPEEELQEYPQEDPQGDPSQGFSQGAPQGVPSQGDPSQIAPQGDGRPSDRNLRPRQWSDFPADSQEPEATPPVFTNPKALAAANLKPGTEFVVPMGDGTMEVRRVRSPKSTPSPHKPSALEKALADKDYGKKPPAEIPTPETNAEYNVLPVGAEYNYEDPDNPGFWIVIVKEEGFKWGQRAGYR